MCLTVNEIFYTGKEDKMTGIFIRDYPHYDKEKKQIKLTAIQVIFAAIIYIGFLYAI